MAKVVVTRKAAEKAAQAKLESAKDVAAGKKPKKASAQDKSIRTIKEAIANMPSEGSKRTNPFITKDTMLNLMTTALNKRYEDDDASIRFMKKDTEAIMEVQNALFQEIAEAAWTAFSGNDTEANGVSVAFWNRTLSFLYKDAIQAPDGKLLHALKTIKEAAVDRGVPTDQVDAQPEVMAALAAFQNSKSTRPAHLRVTFGMNMVVDDEGNLIKKPGSSSSKKKTDEEPAVETGEIVA